MVVIDTNVIVYLLVSGEHTKQAQALYELDNEWHTESFALIELSNVLATLSRNGRISSATARRIFNTSQELLSGRTHSINHAAALELALGRSISAYDARFIAIAKDLGECLTTEDRKLRSASPHDTQSITESINALTLT